MSKHSSRSVTRWLTIAGTFATLICLGDISRGFAIPNSWVPGDLKARWKLDEGSGTSAADASGNGNTGTLQNGPSWVAGRSGQAVSFDGSDDYMSLGAGSTLNFASSGAFTVSAWVKTTESYGPIVSFRDSTNDGAVIDLAVGFDGATTDAGKVMALVRQDGGGAGHARLTGGTVNNGSWRHVALVRGTGGTIELYLDGVSQGTASGTHSSGSLTTNIRAIGSELRWVQDTYGTADQRYLAGSVDEVHVYARALAASEIVGLAQDPALEAWYKFDEGTGTTAKDNSGNDDDGTLQNGATWVTGETGQAVSLDGTNDYVSLGTGGALNFPSSGAFTVSAWVKTTESYGPIVSFRNSTDDGSVIDLAVGYDGSTTDAGKIMALVRQNGGTSGYARVTGGSVSNGAWRHVALVRGTGSTIELFLDGASQGTNSGAHSGGAITSDLRAIGSERLWVQVSYGTADQQYLSGAVDHVRIYSRALSSDEIAGMATGTGTGLSAVYYDNIDWTGTFVQRTDATVNFNWGTGSPDVSIGADTFSAVWTGQVQPQSSETYTFYTNTDDGVRLWVDGQLLIDYPQDQSPTERSGSITLSGGLKYNIRMEYFENGGGAVAELRWSSGSTTKAIIPQSQLYPTDTTAPQILAATAASSDLTKVYVRFSEAMDKATAETGGNWTLSGGLSVSSAVLSSKKIVTLTASGNVTQGTTQVTASNSILGITREALVSPFTNTIVAGNSQGIPDSTAITLTLTTDGNKSIIMFNEPSSHGVPQGLGEMLRVDAPGTTATTVTLQQAKKLGGRGQVYFGDTGSSTTAVVTTSGGTPNVAYVAVRHATTAAFEADVAVEAYVGGDLRKVKDVSPVMFDFSTKYCYVADQTPFTVTGQLTPAIQDVTFTNTTYLLDLGKTDGTTETQLFKMAAPPATNASGQALNTYVPDGVSNFLYDAISPARPSVASFASITLVASPKMCRKKGGEPYCGSDPYEDPFSGPDTPTQGGSSGGVTGGVATSIKLSDGEKKLMLSDLSIKGRGFDFIFGRMYRSSVFERAFAAEGAAVVRDFGVGWTYSYANDYLIKDGTGSEDSANIVVCRSNRETNVFVNIGTKKWSPGKSDYSQLRKNSSGDFEIRHPDGTVWTYHNFQTGTTPNKNGRLKALEDRNGNRMTFFYEQIDPDNTVSGDDKYVLAYVVDTLGREIRYQYFAKTTQTVSGRVVTATSTNSGAFGRLAKVIDWKDNMTFSGSPSQTQDFAGQTRNRTLSFGYDSEGNLVKARKPVVSATPNGNDFSSGKATRYRYYTSTQHPGFTQTQWDALTQAQKDRLLGKLTHIWYPNEVLSSVDTDPADSDAGETIGYETSTSNRFFGFATSYIVSGQNGNGVPSGGGFTYTYTDLNTGHGVSGSPYNFYQVQSLKTVATDRNGNQAEFVFSAEKTLMSQKLLTRSFRGSEPANFQTDKLWNGNGLQRMDRLETQRTNPEGDVVNHSYNDASSDRSQQGNRIRMTRNPGARGGDQSALESVTVFEPIYNHPWLKVSARGSNSSANGFTPPISDPASRTITDPYDNTKTLNLRYAVVSYFDYQESALASTSWSATSSWTPTSVDSVTVKATEVLLVRKLGMPDSNDTERTDSVRELRNRLSANLVKLGLGDLNGDGNTDPVASGNLIRTAYGSPVLIANTNQHKLEGDIETAGDLVDQTKSVVDGGTQEGTNGARLQTIVWMYQYNAFGQMIRSISPEGNVSAYTYFAENDPDGDSVTTPTPADGRTLDTSAGSGGGGYLRDVTADTTRNYVQQTTGTSLSGSVSNNNTNPAITDIKISYGYDDVGNSIRVTNGRGIRTDFFINELNQLVQVTRAADISGAATATPSDPIYNHSDTQQRLTAFAYKTRTFFDYNNNVVLTQIEDRGNTSSVDGSGLGTLPSQATGTTPGLSGADSSGGDAYADTLTLFDRLNDAIEFRSEIDSTRAFVIRFRYDANQHQVLAIYPEGNADSWVYDERNLLFQMVRGATGRPSAGQYASGDPTTFARPGGSGTTASIVTYNYDKDSYLVELVDAVSQGGTTSSIAGSGDVMAYTYDGYNRRKTVTDALGNRMTYLYDPDSNVTRVIGDGDPIDDVAGSSENKSLSATEYVHDELSRVVCTHLVLFQTPDASPSRTPTLSDTAAMDSLAAYLADASSDTSSVPAATGITVIGRVSRLAEYDRESRSTFRIQDDMNVSRSDFDGAGRVAKITDDALSNGFSSGAYNPAAISGNTLEVAYDDDGNVIESKETDVTTVANVAVEVYRSTRLYDALDRLQTTFGNVGRAMDVRYDSRGNRVARADAAGSVSSRSFARRGLGSSASVTINNYGNVSRWTYDGQSRLQETEARLTSSGQGDGTNIGATIEGVQTTAPTVDTAQSGDGLVSVYYAYDDNSQLLALRDDGGNTTAYVYDNQNRLKVERKGLALTGTTFSITGGDSGVFNVSLRGGVSPVDTESSGTDVTRSYDADSNVTSLVDEAGNQFDCTYDALNRRKSCTITAASGFIGTRGSNCQTWKYDGLSRMTECSDGNDPNTTADDVLCTHFYDSLSRKVEETIKIGSLSAKATSYSYDLDCVCGAEGKPNHTIYPDGRDVHTFYDALDRVLYRNDVSGGTSYSNIGTYEYIGKNRVATLTFQNNIRLTHIGQVSGQNADVGFDGDRRIVSHRWESFTTQALGSGTLVMGFEHQDGNVPAASMYDRTSNKKIEYKTHDPTNSEQYKYDSAYRLTSTGSGSQGVDVRAFERGTFTNANRTSMSGGVAFYQDWDLEGVGNWTRQDDNARVETRTHSDFNEVVDRVVSGNTSTLTHDKNGNTTDTGYSSLSSQSFPGGGLRMEWDALGRLRKVYKNNNTPASTGDDVLVGEYLYDAQSRRVRKEVTNSGSLNGTTDFYYDGWRVVEEHDGSDAITNQYTYGNYQDEVWTLDRRAGFTVANLNDNTGVARHFYLSNSLYSVCGITREGSSTTPGTLDEAYQYDAYGKQTVITDGNDADTIVNFSSNDVRTGGGASTFNGSPYMYTGQRFDPESGLMYFKMRFYAPDQGRFLSRDPAKESGSPGSGKDSYVYVGNNPTARLDPSGTTVLVAGGAGNANTVRDLMNEMCPACRFRVVGNAIQGSCDRTVTPIPCTGFSIVTPPCYERYEGVLRKRCECYCRAIKNSIDFTVSLDPAGTEVQPAGADDSSPTPQHAGPPPNGDSFSGLTLAAGGTRNADWISSSGGWEIHVYYPRPATDKPAWRTLMHELCGHTNGGRGDWYPHDDADEMDPDYARE